MKCIKCNKRATETLITISREKKHYCAKHWVKEEGDCLEADLLMMQETKKFDWMSKAVAKEIVKQMPKLAKKYKEILEKVIRQE